MSWIRHLNPHEQSLLRETEQQLLTPPPPRGKLGAWGEKKLTQLAEKVPENLKTQLTNAVSNALEQMRQGSTWLVSRDAVIQRLERDLGPIRGSLDILRQPVHRLDAFCADLVQTNTTGLTLEGAVTGAAGVVGLIADIPILYCCLFRIIQEIAIVYGFPIKPPQERFHVIQVLDLGHSMGSAHRPDLSRQTFQMQEMIGQGTTVEALEAVQAFGMRSSGPQTQALVRNFRLARQLALDLLERKLLQGLVVIGSAIGAASNYQLARDVGLAARHTYRRRFLMEVALRRSVTG
ncbi:MAG: EcsC family protein [Candidatus Eremiobacteraeota bacterium]|nr:EcsC family protein [Candidatus Eremiobacteraeota bacterium]